MKKKHLLFFYCKILKKNTSVLRALGSEVAAAHAANAGFQYALRELLLPVACAQGPCSPERLVDLVRAARDGAPCLVRAVNILTLHYYASARTFKAAEMHVDDGRHGRSVVWVSCSPLVDGCTTRFEDAALDFEPNTVVLRRLGEARHASPALSRDVERVFLCLDEP